MKEFDEMMRELSRNVEIPKEYNKVVKNVLDSLPEKEDPPGTVRNRLNKPMSVMVFSIVIVVCIVLFAATEARAGFFDSFRITLGDLLRIGGDEQEADPGVEGVPETVIGKSDLMLELRERIVDGNGVYLLVKVTAPPHVAITKETGFDYFAFCEGENYNADKLIGGATDCYLLESMPQKQNVATYVVSLSADMNAYAGKEITACFKDFTYDPYGMRHELLVEGMWAVTFEADITVEDKIKIEGTADMRFPFVNTTASLEQVEITPLGITILSDVSNLPFEDLGISDTTITVRLKMIDGSEIPVMPSEEGEKPLVDSGSREYSQENGKSYQKDIFTFQYALDLSRVIGIYIQELYVPVGS